MLCGKEVSHTHHITMTTMRDNQWVHQPWKTTFSLILVWFSSFKESSLANGSYLHHVWFKSIMLACVDQTWVWRSLWYRLKPDTQNCSERQRQPPDVTWPQMKVKVKVILTTAELQPWRICFSQEDLNWIQQLFLNNTAESELNTGEYSRYNLTVFHTLLM